MFPALLTNLPSTPMSLLNDFPHFICIGTSRICVVFSVLSSVCIRSCCLKMPEDTGFSSLLATFGVTLGLLFILKMLNSAGTIFVCSGLLNQAYFSIQILISKSKHSFKYSIKEHNINISFFVLFALGPCQLRAQGSCSARDSVQAFCL